jgi:glutamate 5-kinase
MARANEWVGKMVSLVKSGNSTAAIAQIKVAPSAKDLKQLQAALAAARLAGRWRDVDIAIADNIDALSAPRLHRSP